MKNHGFDKGDFGVDGFSIKAEDVTRPKVTITTPAAGGGDVGTLVPVDTVAVPAPILENSATAIAPVTAGTPVTAPVSSESNVSTPAAMVASVAPATPAALTSVPPVTAPITLDANVSTPVALAATATTATPAAIPVAAAAAPAAPVSVTQSLQSSMASAGLRGTENFDLSVQTTIDACGCASESKCVNSICYCNVGYTGLTCSQKIPVDDASTRLSAATDSTLVRGHQQYRWVMMVFMASFGLMWFSPAIVKRCNRKKDKYSMWHR
jgi:hypothetical protein